MKKIIVILTYLLFSIPDCYAKNWIFIASNQNEKIYIDRDSISRKGNSVYFTSKLEITYVDKINIILSKDQLDCKYQIAKSLSVFQEIRKIPSGKVILVKKDSTPTDFRAYIPSSPNAKIEQIVCR